MKQITVKQKEYLIDMGYNEKHIKRFKVHEAQGLIRETLKKRNEDIEEHGDSKDPIKNYQINTLVRHGKKYWQIIRLSSKRAKEAIKDCK